MSELTSDEILTLHKKSVSKHLVTTQERYNLAFNLFLRELEMHVGENWQEKWNTIESLLGKEQGQWPGTKFNTDVTHCIITAIKRFVSLSEVRPSYDFLTKPLFDNTSKIYWADKKEIEAIITDHAAKSHISAQSMGNIMLALARISLKNGLSVPDLKTSHFLDYAEYCYSNNIVPKGYVHAQNVIIALGWIVDFPLTPNMRKRLYQESVAELVDRRGLQSKVVRDLIVRYLEDLEPTLDHSSLRNLTQRLTRFWHWIETYSPSIDTLRLPPDVARAWKKAVIDADQSEGQKRGEQMFYTVRNFYMDLREWCIHRPDEWSGHLYPSPITDSDMAVFNSTGKFHNQRARMHERIRKLAPHLTRLIGWLRRRLTEVRAIGEQLRQMAVGDQFEVNGVRYERLGPNGLTVFGLQSKIQYFRRADQPKAPRRSIEEEEEVAFWAWAGLEVLRLTGLRIEECLELTDLSLRKLTLSSGETVVVLNIAPSKTDQERMIPVGKELLAVLAQIRRRVAGPDKVVPSTVQYDRGERVMSASLPFLFLRRRHGRQCHVGATFLRDQLELACAQANLRDERGEPVRFVLHDFRRLFATNHVNEGLPVHIVAWMLGHKNLNTTMGYVAVYALEAHHAYHQHLARRRAERPAQEYREPTKVELEQFESHFRRRQLALGNCYRPYQTPCVHEHACVRCPMLQMDPDQLPRLLEIEQDTIRLVTEARANDWVGEVAGLELTLDGIRDKKLQVERIQAGTQ